MNIFDTHKEIKTLTGVGIKAKQAESIVRLVSESRATDLSNLATREQVEVVKEKVDKLEQEIKETRQEIRSTNRWIIGLILAVLTLMAAVLFKK